MGIPELLLILTALVIIGAVARVYRISRDSLHPMIFLGPMLLYVYVFRPAVLLHAGLLGPYFNTSQLTFVLAFKLAANICFCAGCLYGLKHFSRQSRTAMVFHLSDLGRRRAFMIGCGLGLAALGAAVLMLIEHGGLNAYREVYGMGSTEYSGYLYESPSWAMPAIVLMAIARQGQRLRMQDLVLGFLFIGLLLMHAVLGARRGPLFFSLATLGLAWYVHAGRRPSLLKVLLGVGLLGGLALFVLIYRSQIYLGSNFNLDPGTFVEEVFNPPRVNPGDDFLDSSGLILTSAKYGRHTWGTRLLVTFFIRPIPRVVWPTKYADCGFAWMDTQSDRYGYTDREWQMAAGFIPAVGMTAGFDTSFFLDFSWLGFLACYLAGIFFSYVWRKEQQQKGIWQLLLVATLALSIFFPAQEFTPFFYRWLFIAIPTGLLWHLAIAPTMTGGSRSTHTSQQAIPL